MQPHVQEQDVSNNYIDKKKHKQKTQIYSSHDAVDLNRIIKHVHMKHKFILHEKKRSSSEHGVKGLFDTDTREDR